MSRTLALVTSLMITAACGSDDPENSGPQPDAPLPTTDAPAATSCEQGSDHFETTGGFTAVSDSFGFVRVNGAIIGIGGADAAANLVSFAVRDITAGTLDAIGTYDVATQNLKALRAPQSATCEPGNTVCRGFVALAGTYTVLEVQPRYRATFSLSSVHERNDYSDTLGAPLGTVTGCIDKANP